MEQANACDRVICAKCLQTGRRPAHDVGDARCVWLASRLGAAAAAARQQPPRFRDTNASLQFAATTATKLKPLSRGNTFRSSKIRDSDSNRGFRCKPSERTHLYSRHSGFWPASTNILRASLLVLLAKWTTKTTSLEPTEIPPNTTTTTATRT